MLQANALSGFDEVLATYMAEFGVVEDQVAEFGALLDQVHLGQADDLVVEPSEADQFAQDYAGVVETEGLVEIAS